MWAKRTGLLRKIILTPSIGVVWVLGLMLAMSIGALLIMLLESASVKLHGATPSLARLNHLVLLDLYVVTNYQGSQACAR